MEADDFLQMINYFPGKSQVTQQKQNCPVPVQNNTAEEDCYTSESAHI